MRKLKRKMSEEKSIRVIVFDGKQENWRQFKLKGLAKANYLGYRCIFDGNEVIPNESDTLDDSTDAGKKDLKLRVMNANALALSNGHLQAIYPTVMDVWSGKICATNTSPRLTYLWIL